MSSAVDAAVRALGRGGLVVYPTDTLVGLGASATRRAALARLVRAKGRPASQPVSIALSSVDEMEVWTELSQPARAWVRRHLPGPFTVLVRPSPLARRSFSAPILRRGQPLGVRVPDHPAARELARRAGPITATSANRHGAPPARSVPAARRVFGDDVSAYVRDGPRPSGRPSILVDLTGARPRERARG